MDSSRIKARIPAPALGLARHFYRGMNRALARRPRFVIIGTGRCGTGYASSFLNRNGIPCSHEGYFTTDGPMLRNPERLFTARGDASWLAVPYLEGLDIKIAHQVRHPFTVIKSLYVLGFFDPKFDRVNKAHKDFARRHFRVAEDPLDSSIRWYLEWNQRCEDLTDFRYRVEDFQAALPALLEHFGEKMGSARTELPRNVNSRASRIGQLDDRDFWALLCRHPGMPKLAAMAARYGYSLSEDEIRSRNHSEVISE